MEDNLVIHLLLRMDANTLLTVGRTSKRLYQLVCKREVWRWLLKGIEDFTEERLQELKVFVKKAESEEMRQEVLREAAHRLKMKEQVRFADRRGKEKVGLAVSIPGWGNPYIQTDVGLRLKVRSFLQSNGYKSFARVLLANLVCYIVITGNHYFLLINIDPAAGAASAW